MILAAAVVWYDEPLESLERCLSSLVGLIDVLVTADGRWDHFAEGEPAMSPPEQRLLVAALSQRFEHHFAIDPPFPWPGQVEKRSSVYRLGSKLADWTLAIDADEHVEHYDRDALCALLSETDRLTARVASRTVRGPQARAGTALQPRLFSSAGGELRVEGSHNGVRNDRGDWLTGDGAYVPIVPYVDVGEHLRLFHEQGQRRPRERELADRRYRAARRRLRVEGWPPRQRNRA